MNRLRTIYVSALLGAFGGIVAAAIHRYLFVDLLSSPLDPTQRIMDTAVLGLCIGGAIAFFPSFADGLSRSDMPGALKSALIGSLVGAVGGLALGIVESVYLHYALGLLGRTGALAILGTAIGVAEAITGRTRWWRGLVGGFTGGAVAGLVLELVPKTTIDGAASGAAIWTLVLIGFFISLFVALFVNLLTESRLDGLPGSKVEGHTYPLDHLREPSRGILGSSPKGCLIQIPDVRAEQAAISITGAGTRLLNLGESSEVRVNRRDIKSVILRNEDLIELGSVSLRYRESKRVVEASSSLVIRVAQSDDKSNLTSAGPAGLPLKEPAPTQLKPPVPPVPPQARHITVRDSSGTGLESRIRVRTEADNPERHIRVRPRSTNLHDGEA